MEASERPQLPIDDPPGDDGIVRVLDDRLVIERLTVDDASSAHVVRQQAADGVAPATTVAKAIEIGTRIIDHEGTAVNVDYVRRELQAGLGELTQQLSETFESGNGDMAEQIAAAFGVDRSDSVQQQIREIVTKATEQQRVDLMSLLSAEDKTNPLVAVQARMGKALLESEERHRQEMERLRLANANESRAMQQQVAGLKENVARLVDRQGADDELAEAEAAGTRKGRTFEELVHATIEQIAAAQGDAAHHTGDESSEAGGKKGDTVVEIGAALGAPLATMVFEAKNKKLSKNDAWPELNACMAERDAAFAVLVVAGEDKIPAGLEDLTEYQGNKMIVVLDRDEPDPLALRLVYRYVRARLLSTADHGLEVDAAGVRDAAEEAAARLKRANRVRKSLTSVTNSADAARVEFDEMVADVERCLDRIESLIAAAEPDSG